MASRRPRFLLLLSCCALLSVYLLTPTTRSQGTNYSVLYNGTSSYVDVPYNANLNITGVLTVEAWVKTTSAAYQTVLERGDWWQALMSYDLTISEGKVRMDIMQTSGSYVTVIGSTAMSQGVWHHIAGVYDGSQMRVYLDGMLDGTAMASMAPGNNTTGLRIGRSTYLYYPNPFVGRIDEVRVSNAAIYTGNFTPAVHLTATSSTKGLWKFDGETTNDSSSSGANGSLQGGATYSTDVPTGSNAPPNISVTDPLNNTTFASGSNIVIDASASDGDGNVSQVEFFQGATLLGSDSTTPYTFVWNNVAAGSYGLSARATDDLGATTTTTPITVTVTSSGNRSVLFNGTTAYVDVPYNTNLNITGALTVEAWVKTTSTAYQTVVERGDWWQALMSYDLTISEGKVRLDIMQTSGSYVSVIGNTAMSQGVWHHIAGVYDGSQMRVYLDGVLNGTATATMTPGNNTTGLRIGRSTYLYYPNPFVGRIDEVRVSNAAIYSSNFTPAAHLPATSSTKGLWKFDGETANDASGSGANGSLQGGATYDMDVPTGGGGTQWPVAVPGGPYFGQLSQPITFSGAGSFDPDGSITSCHWNFGDGTSANTANPSHSYQTSGLFTATLTVTDNSGLLSSATTSVSVNGAAEARLDPLNETGGGGENPLSRNFNWTLPLVSLPGRAGLDLNLSLAYNSLVWAKNGSTIYFDDDYGFPGPGFRLGFPTIQGSYFNAQTGKWSYLLIGSDGGHTELRQVATSSPLFESADSEHLLLDTTQLSSGDPSMLLRTTAGTQLTYKPKGVAYECTEIKDRNGNFITINYNSSGRIANIHDTLDRTITFIYENGGLSRIEQTWKQPTNPANQITHTWASFTYANVTVQPSFNGLTIVGPNNTTVKALVKVTLDDNSTTASQNSHFDFDYTPFGQVWRISNFAADNHLLNYGAYRLPGSPLWTDAPAQNECPRFTERRDWAEKWNQNGSGTEQEAITSFTATQPGSAVIPGQSPQTATFVQVTNPDATFTKIYYLGTAGTSSGWRVGLPYLVDSFAAGGTTPQRQAVTTWEQDNETVSYQLNPRVQETKIYDPVLPNPKRTEITYQQFTPPSGSSYKLPRDVFEYAADATTILRSTRTDYVDGDGAINAPYLSRRIFGLAKEKQLYEGNVSPSNMRSRIGFSYDEAGSVDGAAVSVQHDNTNYGASFTNGRGNLSTVTRYDVTNGAAIPATLKYNTAGAVVSSKDGLQHEIKIDYTDSFSDGNNARGTFAYPTKLTDPDGYYSTSQYNFDFGAITSRKTPPANYTGDPNEQPAGPEQQSIFDDLGRLERTKSLVNNAYTRYEYPASKIRVKTYTTIVENEGEAYSFRINDGFGRAIATASDHPATPGTVARYDAQRFEYDVMGRVIKTSNPAETSASGDDPSQWQLVEGDAGSSWVYTEQTYDWKDRPLITTNPSLTSNPNETTTKEVSYTGCGCAGGEVVTFTNEVNRRRKVYSDVLGRQWKEEVLNWDGGVYSTTVSVFNVRDQITNIKQYAGVAPIDASSTNAAASCPNPSTTCQETLMTYDGFGRLETRHLPEQQDDPNNPNDFDHTTWTYNPDDTTLTVRDARGAVSTYGYDSRHLVTSVISTLGGSSAINVTYGYDAAGNRTSMAHTVGGEPKDSATYSYDQLSRMMSESVYLNALQNYAPNYGSYTIGYDYTLSNQLKKVIDPFNSPTDITYDEIGRTKTVTGTWNGTNYTYVNNVSYRAWGAVKTAAFNGQTGTVSYNNRMLPTHYGAYDYTYYDDGKLQEFRDLNDQVGNPQNVQFHYMSRRYSYDHAGRSTSVGQLQNYSIMPPFSGNYGYDAFDNLTSRSGSYAINPPQSDSGTYTNNRRTGWTYNAEGKVTNSTDNSDSGGSSTRAWTYDAAGTLIFVSEVRNGQTATTALGYDGDGQLVIELLNGTTADYFIRSTVLGTVLTKLKANGGKDITYVPANGLVAPMQMQDQPYSSPPSYMTWVTRDPLGIQENKNGSLYAYDPFGNLISNVQPPSGGPPPYVPFYGATYGGLSWNSFINANNFSGGCYDAQNRNPALCEMARRMTQEFIGNLPGAHDDLWYAEHVYSGWVQWGQWPKDYWPKTESGNIVGGARHVDPQDTGLKDLSGLIAGARDVIANASGDCAKLLGKDALAKFDAIAGNIQFNGNFPVHVEGLGGDIKDGNLSDVPGIDAVTDVPNKQIYLNPNGRGFNTYTRGGQPFHPLQSTFDKFGISQTQYAFSVLVHEFLHTTGKFKPDSTIGLNGKIDSSKSREYQEKLLKACFSQKKK